MFPILLRNWKWVALLVAAIGILWWSNHRYQAGYRAAQAEMAAQVAKAEAATRVAEIESRKRAEAVDIEYQTKLQDLDARYRDAVGRIGPVRVCKPASRREVPGASEPAGRDHGGAGGDGLPEAHGERDIGPSLVELARLADKQTQQLVACQAFVRSLY